MHMIQPRPGAVDGTLIKYFTREKIQSLPKAPLRSDKPVFIVGMPRSGTSLVEQILASHPAVHGAAGELDFVFRVLLGTLGHAEIGVSLNIRRVSTG